MANHHAAFFKNQIKEVEEVGVESEFFGLGPFLSFLQRFYHHFHNRSRPSFCLRAKQYISGLFQLQAKRNIERITRRVADAEYQSCHHFISNSPWQDAPVLAQIAQESHALLGGHPDSCLIIDPTSFPKKGVKSVGVDRQYSGTTGKIDNVQVAVFSALARGTDVALVGRRLYLPRSWTSDAERCEEAGIPIDSRVYKDRGTLALELVAEADQHGLDYQWVSLDAEFGKPWILHRLHQMGKCFLIDVPSTFRVYPCHPRIKQVPIQGNKAMRLHLRPKNVPVSAIVRSHGKRRWRKRVIRDSTKGPLVAEFLHKKVWLHDEKGGTGTQLVHLIVRRTPKSHGKGWDYKYTLSNAPAKRSTQELAYRQAQRYWVERGFQDLKDSLGLDEYQVRKWRGWHHHVTLTMMAGLYVLERRLENREDLPLLSVTDVCEILAFLLPKKIKTIDHLMAIITERHKQRRRSKVSAAKLRDDLPGLGRASPG